MKYKVFHIMNHPPAYEVYVNIPRLAQIGILPMNSWVGIVGVMIGQISLLQK